MIKINFQKIKFWVMIAIIQMGSFGTGYYCSNYFAKPDLSIQPLQPNITTKTQTEPEKPVNKTVNSVTENCLVKGNISSKSKIYHVKGGSFYDRTDPEMCFQNPEEAEASGFIKSSR